MLIDIPGDEIPATGNDQNKIFANYIFNNIFYECDRITYNRDKRISGFGQTQATHTIFTNNLIYNTPVFIGNSQQTEAQIIDSGNFIGNPKFVGEIVSGLHMMGWDNTYNFMVQKDSPAINSGISIEDMLELIRLDMIRANDANTSVVPMKFSELHLDSLSGSLKPAYDFFGNEIISNDIGVGREAGM